MIEFVEKYINPFTDYGFKKLFGEEPNKDLLLDFLNELLREEQGVIVDLTYLKTEQLGSTEVDRKAIFDLYCENEKGEKFIVELQKTKQNFFKDRSVYYSTFPIRDQAKRAEWDYELKAVYTIAILDFVFDSDKNEPEKFRYDVKLKDCETHRVFYDKLSVTSKPLPRPLSHREGSNITRKASHEDLSEDKILFWLQNALPLPIWGRAGVGLLFEKLFETAEIAKFTPDQVLSYEDSLKYYRDMKNLLDTAKEEGKIEGLIEGKIEGKIEMARNLLEQGIAVSIIAQASGLSIEEVDALR